MPARIFFFAAIQLGVCYDRDQLPRSCQEYGTRGFSNKLFLALVQGEVSRDRPKKGLEDGLPKDLRDW